MPSLGHPAASVPPTTVVSLEVPEEDQEVDEAALVAAKAEALAATMQAHRGKDVDVVAQLREELAACRRQLAAREPGAPAPVSDQRRNCDVVAAMASSRDRVAPTPSTWPSEGAAAGS